MGRILGGIDTMANRIKLKRGLSSKIGSVVLEEGK